jgi:hypothetical protein
MVAVASTRSGDRLVSELNRDLRMRVICKRGDEPPMCLRTAAFPASFWPSNETETSRQQQAAVGVACGFSPGAVIALSGRVDLSFASGFSGLLRSGAACW